MDRAKVGSLDAAGGGRLPSGRGTWPGLGKVPRIGTYQHCPVSHPTPPSLACLLPAGCGMESPELTGQQVHLSSQEPLKQSSMHEGAKQDAAKINPWEEFDLKVCFMVLMFSLCELFTISPHTLCVAVFNSDDYSKENFQSGIWFETWGGKKKKYFHKLVMVSASFPGYNGRIQTHTHSPHSRQKIPSPSNGADAVLCQRSHWSPWAGREKHTGCLQERQSRDWPLAPIFVPKPLTWWASWSSRYVSSPHFAHDRFLETCRMGSQ